MLIIIDLKSQRSPFRESYGGIVTSQICDLKVGLV